MTSMGIFFPTSARFFLLTLTMTFLTDLYQGSFQLTLLGLLLVDLNEGYFRSTSAKIIFSWPRSRLFSTNLGHDYFQATSIKTFLANLG